MVPALVFDPATRERIARSTRRSAFYCGAVASLAAALAARGSRLIVRRGALLATVKKLAREVAADAVVWSAAYDAETLALQRRLQSSLEEAGFRVVVVHDAPAVAPEETSAARSSDGGRGYRALVPYVVAWQAQPRAPLAPPVRFARSDVRSDAPPTHVEFGAVPSAEDPSEDRALAALDAYLEGPGLHYAVARNAPNEPTARLSADLSFGTISARTVLAQIDARANDPFLLTEERLSLKALTRALAQRDFFLQLAWYFEEAPDRPLQAGMAGFPVERRHPALEAWCEGRTGYPLVDAGIRQLRASGWMHPRVRPIAASFLCFDLALDWRVGRDEWERHLIEDAPALAGGNWQWVAGVGADLAQFPRIYNPRKQARALDPRGTYVRRWVAELAALPDADVLDPASGQRRRQLALPLFDGSAYPEPVVEHESAARAYLRRYADYRARAVS